MSQALRLLCIGGHPADTFDCAGGTLAHHVQAGDSVTVMALTQGTRIHDVVISDRLRFSDQMPDPDELRTLMDERARVKEDEVMRACGYLGITDVRFFRYDDEVLTVREELIVRMASLIREVRPDVIVTHDPQELGAYGVHHAVTAQLVLAAMAGAGGVGMGDPNPPHNVAQVYFTVSALQYPLNVLSSRSGWYPDLLVDITDMVEAKVRRARRAPQPAIWRRLRTQANGDQRRRDGRHRRCSVRGGIHHLPAGTLAPVPGVGGPPAPRPPVRIRLACERRSDHRDTGGVARLRAATRAPSESCCN